MKQTFRLRKQSFTFDKKGMILRGEVCDDEQFVLVRAWEDEEATAIEDILNDCEIVEDK